MAQGDYLKVMSWNVMLHQPHEADDRKRFLSGTIVMEEPALLLCQELSWVPSTLISDHLCKVAGLTRQETYILRKYNIIGAAKRAGEKDEHDVAVFVDESRLKVCSDDHKDSNEIFPNFLREEMSQCLGQDQYEKVLRQTAWVWLETKDTATKEEPFKFLAMSIHLPHKMKRQENVHLASAVLTAAFRFAVGEGLPLLVGGDWNASVRWIVQYLGTEVEEMIRLLNDVRSQNHLDGLFLCNGGRGVGAEAAAAAMAYLYKWSPGDNDKNSEPPFRSEAFRDLIVRWNGLEDAEDSEDLKISDDFESEEDSESEEDIEREEDTGYPQGNSPVPSDEEDVNAMFHSEDAQIAAERDAEREDAAVRKAERKALRDDAESDDDPERDQFRKDACKIYGTPGEHLPIMLKLPAPLDSNNVMAVGLEKSFEGMDLQAEEGDDTKKGEETDKAKD